MSAPAPAPEEPRFDPIITLLQTTFALALRMLYGEQGLGRDMIVYSATSTREIGLSLDELKRKGGGSVNALMAGVLARLCGDLLEKKCWALARKDGADESAADDKCRGLCVDYQSADAVVCLLVADLAEYAKTLPKSSREREEMQPRFADRIPF